MKPLFRHPWQVGQAVRVKHDLTVSPSEKPYAEAGEILYIRDVRPGTLSVFPLLVSRNRVGDGRQFGVKFGDVDIHNEPTVEPAVKVIKEALEEVIEEETAADDELAAEVDA